MKEEKNIKKTLYAISLHIVGNVLTPKKLPPVITNIYIFRMWLSKFVNLNGNANNEKNKEDAMLLYHSLLNNIDISGNGFRKKIIDYTRKDDMCYVRRRFFVQDIDQCRIYKMKQFRNKDIELECCLTPTKFQLRNNIKRFTFYFERKQQYYQIFYDNGTTFTW